MYKNSKKKGGIGYQLKVIKQETMVCDWKWYSVIINQTMSTFTNDIRGDFLFDGGNDRTLCVLKGKLFKEMLDINS